MLRGEKLELASGEKKKFGYLSLVSFDEDGRVVSGDSGHDGSHPVEPVNPPSNPPSQPPAEPPHEGHPPGHGG